jgi:hypothetical protein
MHFTRVEQSNRHRDVRLPHYSVIPASFLYARIAAF